MCGFPNHAANIYTKKLFSKQYKVGMCEQLEDPRYTKGIVKRDLTQIVSIGTVINNDSLNEKDNNYIGALLDFNHAYVLAYTDISTGDVYATILEHNVSKIVSEIVSNNIKEMIISAKVDPSVNSILKNQFGITTTITDEINNIKE